MTGRTAVVLCAVGLLCLLGPQILWSVTDPTGTPDRDSRSYSAERIDATHATDRALVVAEHGSAVSLSLESLWGPGSGRQYLAPNATHRALLRAIDRGSAAVDDPDVRADLRTITRDYPFVTRENATGPFHYRVRLGDGNETVTATAASNASVANATIEAAAVPLGRISAAERRTVKRIVENATADGGYEPAQGEPLPDLPMLVERDGAVYHVSEVDNGDHVGPAFPSGRYAVSMFVSMCGVVLILTGVGVSLADRYEV